jgi:hypothetical protein
LKVDIAAAIHPTKLDINDIDYLEPRSMAAEIIYVSTAGVG